MENDTGASPQDAGGIGEGGQAGAAPPAEPCILIVDDNASNVRLLERMLHRAGYLNTVAIMEAVQVLATVRAVNPDLVLLDLHMPGMSGFEVLAAIRETVAPYDFLPIVIVTADASRVARDHALEAGATDFITKPFDYSEVVLRARNLLRTRRLNQQLRRHASVLEGEVGAERAHRQVAERARKVIEAKVRRVLEGGGFDVAYQPIVDLRTGVAVGVEALARFEESPARPPNEWFADADSVGLGVEAELQVASRAIAKWAARRHSGYLAVNLSPDALCSGALVSGLLESAPGKLVVELTEHVAVPDYAKLLEVRAQLKSFGVGLAIDDTGAGISSFQHVLWLSPDVIKLDRSLIQGVDHDPGRRALAGALLALSDSLGATVIAEGIETPEELRSLRDLGVPHGQGYLLGRPALDLGPSGYVAAAVAASPNPAPAPSGA